MNGDSSVENNDVIAREIDEKLRARVKKRGILIAFTCVLIALFLLFLIFFFVCKFYFSVGEIQIEGNEKYTNEEILKASQIEIGDSLFFLSEKKAEEHVKTAFPFIEDVEILKEYPKKLKVQIKEEKPLFYFKIAVSDEMYAVVSGGEKVLSLHKNEKEVLENYSKDFLLKVEMPPVLSAVVGDKLTYKDEKDGLFLLKLIEIMEKSKFSHLLLRIDGKSRFNIRVYLGNRENGKEQYEILLGNQKQMEEKLAFAFEIMKELDDGFVGMISVEDLKNGFARPEKAPQ